MAQGVGGGVGREAEVEAEIGEDFLGGAGGERLEVGGWRRRQAIGEEGGVGGEVLGGGEEGVEGGLDGERQGDGALFVAVAGDGEGLGFGLGAGEYIQKR